MGTSRDTKLFALSTMAWTVKTSLRMSVRTVANPLASTTITPIPPPRWGGFTSNCVPNRSWKSEAFHGSLRARETVQLAGVRVLDRILPGMHLDIDAEVVVVGDREQCTELCGQPRARVGVDVRPALHTEPPTERTPAEKAEASIGPEIRGSRPTTTSRWREPTARPTSIKSSGVTSTFATPRIPEDPNGLTGPDGWPPQKGLARRPPQSSALALF